MSWRVAIELVHVVSAMVFVAGYIGTNVLTELARQTDDPVSRTVMLGLSGRFDGLLLIPFGTLAGLSGLVLFPTFGYPITSQWVWLSALLYLGVIGLGVTVWRARGMLIGAALAADDDDAVIDLIREPRYVALSRGENVAVFIIVVLMIVRPS